MPDYRIGRLKGRFVVTWKDAAGKRRRYRLDARSKGEAEREAPGIVAALTRPQGTTVKELWDGFVADREGRAIIATMTHTWKAVGPRFGAMAGDAITLEDCRAHAVERRRSGIKPGTIATELGHVRMVLLWAEKNRPGFRASYIERPSPPRRPERHLTREQCRKIIEAASFPHVRLFIIAVLATGARSAALRELTWDRCNFERGMIDLRNPHIDRPHKGRAVVPMNRALRAALLEAREGAISDHIIEWAGQPVGSVKRGLKSAAAAAGIEGSVHPHLFRHSAAVHMAESGISMDEIAQYLGHEDVNVTRRIYARFSPTYLRKAADVLQYDDFGSMNQKGATQISEEAMQVLDFMVGAAGIEPATPTMSTKVAGGKGRK